jgi:hypothetical protein
MLQLDRVYPHEMFSVKPIGRELSQLYRFGVRTHATSSSLFEQFTRVLTGLGPRKHLTALDA